MKQIFHILITILFLIACNQKVNAFTDKNINSGITINSNSLSNIKIERKFVSDSLLQYDSTSFEELELNFVEITKNEFESYLHIYKTECVLDSGQFISNSGLYVSHNCVEICETYLRERKTDRKMLLPSTYDAGILGMLLSPTCKQFIIYSSYDGTDYNNYYEDRAEFFVFNISKDKGLKSIIPYFEYHTKDYSIDQITWVNEKTIALKIYKEDRFGNGENVTYSYYKTDINK